MKFMKKNKYNFYIVYAVLYLNPMKFICKQNIDKIVYS